MAITLKNPSAPATKKQLFMLKELSGIDYDKMGLTMQEASDKIKDFELAKIAREVELSNQFVDESEVTFTEAKVTLVEGDQRGGKSVYAVGKIVDSYFNDCVRIYCEEVLKIQCEVKAYYRKDRVAKIKYNGKKTYIKIPDDYKLHSPMRIFSNIHLFGVPFVYVPSFRHMLEWLKRGIIRDGWLLMDETHRGISARNGMSAEGREWVGELFQLGKDLLNVIIITHHAKMIEGWARTIPTQRVTCRYEEKTHEVVYNLRKKGQEGTREQRFDASQYFGNYRSNEKVYA